MSKTLPQLTSGATLDGTEEMLINQGGNPRRTTVAAVAKLGPGGTGAPLFSLNIMDFIPNTAWASIQAYHYPGDPGTFDCYSSILNAIAALPVSTAGSGGVIYFPPGAYFLSQTIQLKKPVQLIGAGGISRTTIISWSNNVAGIVVNDFDTNNNAIESPPTTTAGGSWFKGISFEGNGQATGNVTGDGIRLRARAHFEDCQVTGFPGNGINIGASVGGDDADRGNANNWSIKDVVSHDNGGNGVLVYGTDTNAGIATGYSASTNGGWGTTASGGDCWGVYDGSFLGNSWIGCHTEFNGSGPYRATSTDARSVFIGCYSEQDSSGGSEIISPSMVFGGIHAAGFKSTTTGLILIGNQFNRPIEIDVTGGSRDTSFLIGYGGSGLTLRTSGDTTGAQIGWWLESAGCFVDQAGFGDGQAYSGVNCILRTTDLTSFTDFDTSAKMPAGWLMLPQTYYVNLGGLGKKVTVTWGAAAPTTGTWTKGNIVYNTAPTAGGTIGWVCTTAGTPGTWKTFGAISA